MPFNLITYWIMDDDWQCCRSPSAFGDGKHEDTVLRYTIIPIGMFEPTTFTPPEPTHRVLY